MNEEQEKQLVSEAENIEAIRDFFIEWYSLEELYETLAKASTTIIYLCNRNLICEDDKKVFEKLAMQHEMMVEHMKVFIRKEADDEKAK